ncbi:MAG: hypothetical protein KKF27_21500 [Gammaproteobacteria bacterium]|nr:hypothetical protein [Gammaproteobacteria bacterium]
MKLLISTSKGYYVVNNDKSLTPVLVTEDKKSYGISWNKEQVFFCRQFPDHSKILIYDKKLKPVKEIRCNDIMDGHQLYWSEPYLYICNTRFNRIHIWHPVNGFKDFAWNRCGKDRNHINSIWQHDNGDIYFIEHNRHINPSRRSRIKIFDKNLNYKSDIQAGRGAHNVFRRNADLYLCSSNDYSLIKYDCNKKEVIEEINFPDQGILSTEFWLTRGLAYDGNKFYVGLSRWCPREERIKSTNGAIAIVDNQFRLIEYIALPDMGQVYEIRLMDGIDLAHNRIKF